MLEVQTSIQETSFELKHAILFYCSNNNILATFHNVKNRKLLAGKSLSVADLEELFHSENQKQKMLTFHRRLLHGLVTKLFGLNRGKFVRSTLMPQKKIENFSIKFPEKMSDGPV